MYNKITVKMKTTSESKYCDIPCLELDLVSENVLRSAIVIDPMLTLHASKWLKEQ